MDQYTPVAAIQETYGVKVSQIGKSGDVSICKSTENQLIYLVDYSTLIRWESALRRILEYIAKTPSVYSQSKNIRICLVIVDQTNRLTYSDKMYLSKALEYVNAKPLVI